jgi:hypothetical protein
MRHLIGVLLAVVMAAALFLAASWGYQRLLIVPGRALPAGGGSLLHDRHVVAGFGALLGTGLLAGILVAVPRVSPLASGLPGLALLAVTGVYLASVRHAVRLIPLRAQPYGAGFEAMLFDGVLAVVGLVMIIPLFVPSRGRRPAAATWTEPDREADGGYAGQAAQGDVSLLSDWTPTRPQPRVGPDAPGSSQPPWPPADYG